MSDDLLATVRQALAQTYPAVRSFDIDGDGVIETSETFSPGDSYYTVRDLHTHWREWLAALCDRLEAAEKVCRAAVAYHDALAALDDTAPIDMWKARMAAEGMDNALITAVARYKEATR